MTALGRSGPAAALVGSAAAFVAGVGVAGAIRPALLLDPDPAWAPMRLLLTLAVAGAAASAGAAAAAIVLAAARSDALDRPLAPIDLPRGALAAIAAAALVLGGAIRFAWLEQIPFPLFHDELLMVPDALSLEGTPSDFRDAVRMIRDDAGRPAGTVGVLYLEGFRASLRAFGSTVLGVRFLSALGGVLSLLTGVLLAQTLLPTGGAALVAVILAGLRWHLLLSRFAWVLIAVVPLLDVAALLAIRARRRGTLGPAAAAGLAAGVGAHIYLSAWVAGAALGGVLVWPGGAPRKRAAAAAVFGLAFAAAVLPLFLLREGRRAAYFVRAGNHNVLREVQRTHSVMPVLRAVRIALLAPWLPEPSPTNDLIGQPRLPFLLAAALALAYLRAFARPREDLSALLLAQAAAAFLASVAWGERMSPNGSRFAYLTTVLAVGAAAGLLWLAETPPRAWRRPAAIALFGALFAFQAEGIGSLAAWDAQQRMYVDFVGQHTSVGRAAARWEPYGDVVLEPSPLYGLLSVDTIRRYRILPRREAARALPSGPRDRVFRIALPESRPGAGERRVEWVRDASGKTWAVVMGRRKETSVSGFGRVLTLFWSERVGFHCIAPRKMSAGYGL